MLVRFYRQSKKNAQVIFPNNWPRFGGDISETACSRYPAKEKTDGKDQEEVYSLPIDKNTFDSPKTNTKCL